MIQAIHRYKARFFQALAHPVRIRILELLRDGPRSVGELQSLLTVEGSNVSQQLAVLRKEHIVENTKEGTTVIYQVVDPLVFQILDVSRQMFQHQLSQMISAMAEDPDRGDDKPVG